MKLAIAYAKLVSRAVFLHLRCFLWCNSRRDGCFYKCTSRHTIHTRRFISGHNLKIATMVDHRECIKLSVSICGVECIIYDGDGAFNSASSTRALDRLYGDVRPMLIGRPVLLMYYKVRGILHIHIKSTMLSARTLVLIRRDLVPCSEAGFVLISTIEKDNFQIYSYTLLDQLTIIWCRLNVLDSFVY